MKKKIKIAMAQISCIKGDKKANLKKIEEYTEDASNEGANLIIFPELSLTGYYLRDEIYNLAEEIPGPSTTAVEKIAKKFKIHIIFGMPELSSKTHATIYNAAVLIGPNGYIGRYRKMHLPMHSVFEEKRYFRPGYEIGVFETDIGKIGLLICYDLFFPEASRLIRLNGAKLTVCISASPTTRRAFFETLTAARAIENVSFLAYVNLVGMEDGLQFWGGSRLLAPDGKIITKAKYDEEDLIIDTIDYADIRTFEVSLPTLKDLRPELFEKLKEEAKKL